MSWGLPGSLAVHQPPGHTTPAGPPVVLALHGRWQTGTGMAELSHKNEVADRNGFAVVHPASLGFGRSELGPFQTAHKRLVRWAVDGTWQEILTAVLAAADAVDDTRWTVSVDSTLVRAHRHSVGARRKEPKAATSRPPTPSHALARSRGGLSTKVHLAADCQARPLALIVTAGESGDASAFGAVMSRVRVPRGGPGRPRTRPWPCSRNGPTHLRRRGTCGHSTAVRGRPPAEFCKPRKTDERCSSASSSGAARPARWDKLAIAYQAAFHLAAILIWARR
ncbi:IS5/IS1182 family transposase [Streptomyces virginiae]